MDGILIFVRASFFCWASVDVNFIPISGWFILCRSYRVRRPKDSGFESEPCRRVSLLSESNSLYYWPNIATNRLGGPPDLFQLHSLHDLRPSASDRRVNIFWITSLIYSLNAALLSMLVRRWASVYMRIFQQSRSPLNTARIRQFSSEGAKPLPTVAEFVPGLIHISLFRFFLGLGNFILQIDTAIFVTIAVPIVVCIFFYLYCMFAPIWNPKLPYRTLFSDLIQYLVRRLHHSRCYSRFRGKLVSPASVEVRQEKLAVKSTKGRMDRDVRAVQWLIDNINGSNETHTFVLEMPGSFNQEWGRAVWKSVVRDDQSTSPVDKLHPSLPYIHKGTTANRLCRWVRDVFENKGDSVDTKVQRMRMRKCIEATSSLVCCTDVKLGLFEDIAEVLSEMGDIEQTNNSLTSDRTHCSPSAGHAFLLCLSGR